MHATVLSGAAGTTPDFAAYSYTMRPGQSSLGSSCVLCRGCIGSTEGQLALFVQYLEELMSTRIGVKRSGEVMSATERMGPDGKKYYDIQVCI